MNAYHADSNAAISKEVLSYEEFGRASRELAAQIVSSGFHPEIIVAIARGGMIPGGALSYALGVKLVDAINIEFYTDVEQTLPDPILLAPLLDAGAIQGKKVLVVDDVADSGRTLQMSLELLTGMGADVRTAVLYAKPRSVMQPEYIWRTTDDWIVFPWSAEPPLR